MSGAAGSDTIHNPAEEVAILQNARNRSGVLVQCPYPGEQILDDVDGFAVRDCCRTRSQILPEAPNNRVYAIRCPGRCPGK